MKPHGNKNTAGFSLIELIISMTITLLLLGIVSILLSGALGTRKREGRKTDALTSSEAALNLLSREIGNSGYGLTTNGIVTTDSSSQMLHFRANVENTNSTTTSPGEDLTYYYDSQTESIVRFDPNDNSQTAVIVSRISDVTFQYFDYTSNSTPVQRTTPTNNTGRVRINITVRLESVEGQPDDQTVSFTSDVTLRNSNYMLKQY